MAACGALRGIEPRLATGLLKALDPILPQTGTA
jgi:hypothetical protein